MQQIEQFNGRIQLFIFDLEFIGDVRRLDTCRIWEIAVLSHNTNCWFNAVVDPDPTMETFPPPPIPEIPQLERSFLTDNDAQSWKIAFDSLIKWIAKQALPNAIPVFVSHNTFRADKPLMELECRRHNCILPSYWYFFDSLHFARRVMPASTCNYSLTGLHKQLFNREITHAHRAKADVLACTHILNRLTQNTMSLVGPVYPAYATSMRSIRWIGEKAEETLFGSNVRSVESLFMFLQDSIRMDFINHGKSQVESILKTLNGLFGNQLPKDNIQNIAKVVGSTFVERPFCHTFMAHGVKQ